MASFGLLGDATTTTALALASSWPVSDDAVLVEADPSGGSLAAWLDVPLTPSISSMVAAVHRSSSRAARRNPAHLDDEPGAEAGSSSPGTLNSADDPQAVFDSLARRAPGGLRFAPCPFTVREAERALAEAATSLFPAVIGASGITTLFDLGRARPTSLPATIEAHDLAIVVHRQEAASASAAAVRLERCAELVAAVRRARERHATHDVMLAVIGDRPFDADELAAHCSVPSHDLLTLADDSLTASLLAGGGSMSPRRLRRQPLISSARAAAASLVATTTSAVTPPIADRLSGTGAAS